MVKLYRKLFLTSLTIIVFVFGMSTNVFAPTPIFAYEGNILHPVADEITALISEVEEDLYSYIFEDLNSTNFIFETGKAKGKGKPQSVPDADIMLLLGPALLFLVLLKRREIKV